MPLVNKCGFRPASGGTGAFVVASALPGCYTPDQCANPPIEDGNSYSYAAESDDETENEEGQGVYDVATTTLTRATIRSSSNAGAAVDFAAAPKVILTALAQDIASDVIADAPLNGSEIVYLVQGGVNKQTTTSNIRELPGDFFHDTSENVITDNTTPVEIDPDVFITYVTTDGSGLEQDVTFPSLDADTAGVLHLVVLQTRADPSDVVRVPDQDPNLIHLVEEGDYCLMRSLGSGQWIYITGRATFPNIQSSEYPQVIALDSDGSTFYLPSNDFVSFDQLFEGVTFTGPTANANKNVFATYITTDGSAAEQTITLGSASLSDAGKLHFFVLQSQIDPADIVLIAAATGIAGDEEIRLTTNFSWALFQCQGGGAWLPLMFGNGTTTNLTGNKILQRTDTGALSFEVVAGGGEGSPENVTLDSGTSTVLDGAFTTHNLTTDNTGSQNFFELPIDAEIGSKHTVVWAARPHAFDSLDFSQNATKVRLNGSLVDNLFFTWIEANDARVTLEYQGEFGGDHNWEVLTFWNVRVPTIGYAVASTSASGLYPIPSLKGFPHVVVRITTNENCTPNFLDTPSVGQIFELIVDTAGPTDIITFPQVSVAQGVPVNPKCVESGACTVEYNETGFRLLSSIGCYFEWAFDAAVRIDDPLGDEISQRYVVADAGELQALVPFVNLDSDGGHTVKAFSVKTMYDAFAGPMVFFLYSNVQEDDEEFHISNPEVFRTLSGATPTAIEFTAADQYMMVAHAGETFVIIGASAGVVTAVDGGGDAAAVVVAITVSGLTTELPVEVTALHVTYEITNAFGATELAFFDNPPAGQLVLIKTVTTPAGLTKTQDKILIGNHLLRGQTSSDAHETLLQSVGDGNFKLVGGSGWRPFRNDDPGTGLIDPVTNSVVQQEIDLALTSSINLNDKTTSLLLTTDGSAAEQEVSIQVSGNPTTNVVVNITWKTDSGDSVKFVGGLRNSDFSTPTSVILVESWDYFAGFGSYENFVILDASSGVVTVGSGGGIQALDIDIVGALSLPLALVVCQPSGVQIVPGAFYTSPLPWLDDLDITNQNAVTSLTFNNLGGVKGDVSPNNMGTLEMLDFPVLVVVGAHFQPNDTLPNVSSMDISALQAVGRNFAPSDLPALLVLEANELVVVGGHFQPNTFAVATSLSASSLTTVGENVQLYDCPEIATINLSALIQVGGEPSC